MRLAKNYNEDYFRLSDTGRVIGLFTSVSYKCYYNGHFQEIRKEVWLYDNNLYWL